MSDTDSIYMSNVHTMYADYDPKQGLTIDYEESARRTQERREANARKTNHDFQSLTAQLKHQRRKTIKAEEEISRLRSDMEKHVASLKDAQEKLSKRTQNDSKPLRKRDRLKSIGMQLLGVVVETGVEITSRTAVKLLRGD